MNDFAMLWEEAQTLFAITIDPIEHGAIPAYYDDLDWPLAFVLHYTSSARPYTSWFQYYAFAGLYAQPLTPKQHFQQFLAGLSDVEGWTDAEIIAERELFDCERTRRDIAIMRENARSFKFLVGDDFYSKCVQVGGGLSTEDFADRSEQ